MNFASGCSRRTAGHTFPVNHSSACVFGPKSSRPQNVQVRSPCGKSSGAKWSPSTPFGTTSNPFTPATHRIARRSASVTSQARSIFDRNARSYSPFRTACLNSPHVFGRNSRTCDQWCQNHSSAAYHTRRRSFTAPRYGSTFRPTTTTTSALISWAACATARMRVGSVPQ